MEERTGKEQGPHGLGPTLVVVTSHNDQPYDLHRLLPQLPNTMIAGTSRWPHLDKPDEFNRVLDAFLRRLNESRGDESRTCRSPETRIVT